MYLWLSVVNDNPVVRVLQKINTEKIKNNQISRNTSKNIYDAQSVISHFKGTTIYTRILKRSEIFLTQWNAKIISAVFWRIRIKKRKRERESL